MKYTTILLLFICSIAYGQAPSINISGIVKESGRDSALINGVTIIIKGSDNSRIETKTNSNGFFSIDCCTDTSVNYMVSTFVGENVFIEETFDMPDCKDKSRKYTKHHYFINSSMAYHFINNDPYTTKVKCDFFLNRILISYPTLTFQFKYNSSEYSNKIDFNYYSIDSAINVLYDRLQENCRWIISLIGFADNLETNPMELSKQRVEKIRNALILKGINPKRLEIKWVGAMYYTESEEEIKSIKEQTVERQKKCIVGYRLLSNDFRE